MKAADLCKTREDNEAESTFVDIDTKEVFDMNIIVQNV